MSILSNGSRCIRGSLNVSLMCLGVIFKIPIDSFQHNANRSFGQYFISSLLMRILIAISQRLTMLTKIEPSFEMIIFLAVSEILSLSNKNQSSACVSMRYFISTYTPSSLLKVHQNHQPSRICLLLSLALVCPELQGH